MKHNENEKLTMVEIWDSNQRQWEEYDCPDNGITVKEYAEWCVENESPMWATVNGPDDNPIRLNGWKVVDPFGAK